MSRIWSHGPSGAGFPEGDWPLPENAQPRLDFLGITDADAEILRQLQPVFASQAEALVERFYQHLFGFPETARLLQDPALVARLKEAQKRHFSTLLDANWDRPFLDSRRRVGQAHAETGLGPQYFLSSYYQLLQDLLKVLVIHLPESLQTTDWQTPLLRAVFFDIGLTLDAYFVQLTRNFRDVLDMYWQANNELRQFARLASHDLKTPLATVANLCDEALDEFESEIPIEARRLIDAARVRTMQMSKMLDELLNFPIDTPTADATLDDIPCQEAVLEAVERVMPMFREKQIEIVVPESYPYVWGNKVQLREALYNLLMNAGKFIHGRPGRVEVRIELEPRHCVICVSDNGPGIPSDEIDRIFVPYRRLARDHDRPGSGLGLYFAKTLIEKQGGRLWVESPAGEGSRFYLLLWRHAPGREKS